MAHGVLLLHPNPLTDQPPLKSLGTISAKRRITVVAAVSPFLHLVDIQHDTVGSVRYNDESAGVGSEGK